MVWHAALPTDIDIEVQQGGDRETYVHRTKGTVFEEIKELLLAVGGVTHSLACRSTLRTFARRWNSHQMQIRSKSGAVMPSFSRRYRLLTIQRSNRCGKWAGLDFEDISWATKEEFQNACALYRAIKSEAQRPELPTPTVTQLPAA